MEDKKTLKITGMTCTNCARIVERSLSKVEGVKFAAVNLATNTAFVVLDKPISEEALVKAVQSVGYDVSNESVERIEEKRLKRIKTNMLISLSVSIPLMLLMFLHMSNVHIPYFSEFEIVLSAVAIFYAGRDTVRACLIALMHKHANMDTLIIFGSVTAWLTSIINYFGINVHPFGTIGAMIISLHLVGRFIESYLRDKASKQIQKLLSIQSKEAQVLTEKGEFMMPIEAIKEGFTVLVKPGDRIPTDGVILDGETSVDESMITGEPIPVVKSVGDEVIGGSLNLSGLLKIKVTKTGEDTFLSKMISLIQQVQGSKVPIQALADTITNWFVPLIIFLALLSGIVWYFGFDTLNILTKNVREVLPWSIHIEDRVSFGIFVFLTTVVIACPCALGLATPMALIVGTSIASKRGLLIRNAEAIQTAKEVGYVLFDKTGTITKGKPVVVHAQCPLEDKEYLSLIESYSNHPLAKAIVEYLGRDNKDGKIINFEEFSEVHGEGVYAKINGQNYFIGKPRDFSKYENYLSVGASVVEVVKNDNVIGFFVFQDILREDSKDAVKKLSEFGIVPVMVTGDNEKTARYIANAVGINYVYANAKPQDKLSVLREFQSKGKKVIMVGDGINDAIALKGADIGIAIGSGSDLAIDNADIIITKGGISKVVDAIQISKATFKIIKENLIFAFFYNILAIPLAMLGLLHPAIAEGAMATSSITVIVNSLRLSKFSS